MHREPRRWPPERPDRFTTASGSQRSDTDRLVRILQGRPAEEVRLWCIEEKRSEREQLEFLATFSSEHARELNRLNAHRDASRHAREQALWEHKVLGLPLPLEEWNEADHPRTGTAPNAGWFASKGGGTASGGSSRTPADPNNPAHWYLPSDDKGTWTGKKGNSTFRLKKPINVDGKLVHEIPFKDNLPVLDDLTLPGKTPVIILTGDPKIDRKNAEDAWRKLNPGKDLPSGTFHHDLLHATVETKIVDGKKTSVVVGKMRLVPTEVHESIYHEGTASAARKLYDGLGIDRKQIAEVARKEALIAGDEKAFVTKAAKKIIPNSITKKLTGFIGRNVLRAIPIISTGLAVLEFSDNVEAHGVGGAVARATPVLGDLMSAHDLGSDLAREIMDDATSAGNEHLKEINKPASDAWKKASEQTADAFKDLAPHIQVTNTYGENGLVNPHEVSDALRKYRDKMYTANYLQNHNVAGHNHAVKAAEAKKELKADLERASQKQNPPQAPKRPATFGRNAT